MPESLFIINIKKFLRLAFFIEHPLMTASIFVLVTTSPFIVFVFVILLFSSGCFRSE